jgi:hypothetical protein
MTSEQFPARLQAWATLSHLGERESHSRHLQEMDHRLTRVQSGPKYPTDQGCKHNSTLNGA